MTNVFMMGSLLPYLIFLYFVYRIYKLDPRLLSRRTFIGFCSMLGFIFVTAVTGYIAIKIMGARTLGHVDFLHAVAEFGLSVTNGLIAFGLKKQLNELDRADAIQVPPPLAAPEPERVAVGD
jgi:hypothetical protein